MATHSSTLAWRIPWTEEPGRLKSMESQRVRQDWATSLSLFPFMPSQREGNGNPPQCSCLENPRDRGAWWAAIYGVAQDWTWLKRLSSSKAVIFSLFSFFLTWWCNSLFTWFTELILILHPPILKIVYLMENFRFVNVVCMVFFLFHGSFVCSNFVYFYPVFLDLNYLSFSVLLFFPNIARIHI